MTAVKTFAEKLRQTIPELKLPDELSAEVSAEIATVKSQLKSPKPKTNILTESLRSIQRIFERAGGSVAAQILVELGKLFVTFFVTPKFNRL